MTAHTFRRLPPRRIRPAHDVLALSAGVFLGLCVASLLAG